MRIVLEVSDLDPVQGWVVFGDDVASTPFLGWLDLLGALAAAVAHLGGRDGDGVQGVGQNGAPDGLPARR